MSIFWCAAFFLSFFFFFNDTATTEIYTLSLHDALPIYQFQFDQALMGHAAIEATGDPLPSETLEKCGQADAILLGAVGHPMYDNNPDRKSTRLNSSHWPISYAVFCLKKKKKQKKNK